MENPPDMIFLIVSIIVGLSLILFSFYFWDIVVVTLFLLTGIFALVTPFLKEYAWRPAYVRVADTGLVLRYRNGKTRFVLLADVQFVYVSPRDPDTFSGKITAQGRLRIKGIPIFGVRKPIAKAIEETLSRKKA